MPLVASGPATAERPHSREHEHARKIRPELTRGPLVKVAWAPHQAQGELVQGILLDEGVPSVLRRSGGADVPDFLAAGPRDVMVPESAVEVARSALSSPERASPPAREATRDQALRLGMWLLAGTGVGALIAWALTHAL